MDPHKKIYVDEIRKVHKNLRRNYQKDQDFMKIWNDHCKDEEILDKYAKSMQDLAREIWDEDCDGTHRIKWCVETCRTYFHYGELERILEKDVRREEHYEKDPTAFHRGPNLAEEFFEDNTRKEMTQKSSKLRLLDVGSCYDPFKGYEEFATTAIDLKPACENVHKCDFIKVEVTEDCPQMPEGFECQEIHKLQSSAFDIVVFSLLLTYIPSPRVRWEMCEKAHRLMKSNGLLLIITPDSSHQNKNAALMKIWKFSIELIGFQRIKYSKDRHLHFMAFRKVPCNFLWDRRRFEDVGKLDSLCLNIPQDFQDGSESESDDGRVSDDDSDFILDCLGELPQLGC